MESSLVLIVAIILTFPLFLYSFLWKSGGSVRKEPPQAGGAWPIFGHLRLFSGSYGPPHLALAKLADTYGPIFTMMFGVKKALVVSSWEMAKECLKTNDTVFSGRAKSLAFEILGSNYAFFPFSSYGYYFSQVRKMVMLELLSPHRVELVKHIRESEVNTAIKETYERWRKDKKSSGSNKVVVEMKEWFGNVNEVVVEMKEWFGNVNENVIFRMIIGKTFPEATKNYANNLRGNLMVRKIFKDFLVLEGAFVWSDGIPWLRWLDLGGQKKAMRKISKEVDQVLQGWVEEHKQKRKIDGQVKGEDECDFMDAMLSVLDGSKITKEYYDADTISKYTALALLLAGGDVTTVTMTWVLGLLLNNPKALKKVQEELDKYVGRERQVKESDIDNLVYLQAVIKETLRLYLPGPLLLPHESLEDCTVGGYHIPAKTRLYVNVGKIQRDPKVWSDPEEFRPERFLATDKKFDVRGQDFELIPFGSGRRMCPGIALAIKILPLSLASLLHGFDITPRNETVDMSESIQLTNHKATGLEVLLAPRLPAQLYEDPHR